MLDRVRCPYASPGSTLNSALYRFYKTDSGVKIQELRVGSGTEPSRYAVRVATQASAVLQRSNLSGHLPSQALMQGQGMLLK